MSKQARALKCRLEDGQGQRASALRLWGRDGWLARNGLACLLITATLLYIAGGLAYVVVGEGTTLFVNDGFQYYCYLPSLILDRDLDFTNQYEIGRRHNWGAAPSPFVEIAPETGRPGNAWSMGPALLWMPFFLLGLAFESLLVAGSPDGFSMWCQWPTYLGSLAYGLLGVWLLYRKVLGDYDPLARLIVVAILLVGTNLSYYFLFAGHMSHTLSFFAIALHIYCLKRLADQPKDLRWYLFSGLSLALAGLVRWQDAVVGLLTLVVVVRCVISAGSVRRGLIGVALGLACLSIGVAVQALTWHAIYGRFFLIPQGGGWMTWTRPYLVQVLFSYPKGLFLNSPVLLLALVGLVYWAVRDRWWAAGSLVALGAAVYVCAASSQWGAGESFGMRRLVGMLPVLAIGLCELMRRVQGRSWATALWSGMGVALLWNWVLLFQYFLERLQNP